MSRELRRTCTKGEGREDLEERAKGVIEERRSDIPFSEKIMR